MQRLGENIVSVYLTPTDTVTVSTFLTACAYHYDCLPSIVETLPDDWTVLYCGMETMFVPKTGNVISKFIVYLKPGEDQALDFVDILWYAHVLVSTNWIIRSRNLNLTIDLVPEFFHPMEVAFILKHHGKTANHESLQTYIANHAQVKVVAAWTLEYQVKKCDLPLYINDQSVYYLKEDIFPETAYFSKHGTDFIYKWPRQHTGQINKMYYCNQILLKTNEVKLLCNEQIVYYMKPKRYMYLGEFRIHRDLMTRKMLGVFICVEDFLNNNNGPIVRTSSFVVITLIFMCLLAI